MRWRLMISSPSSSRSIRLMRAACLPPISEITPMVRQRPWTSTRERLGSETNFRISSTIISASRGFLFPRAPALRHVDIDKRWVQSLLCGRHAQRHQGLGVERHREPDDRLDTAEVLSQRYELVGKHYLREIVE